MHPTTSDVPRLHQLLSGMRDAYARGENAMAYARQALGNGTNLPIATLVAYDLQAGAYVARARQFHEIKARGCAQIAEILAPWMNAESSIIEVGCGEATTLAGVVARLPARPAFALGFDISWSRCAEGTGWLAEQNVEARLFVADLFEIPLASGSIDVVYTSHSLEPNGGREEEALRELLRVARRAVVLIEPLYELANEAAQARMREHGYVRNLKATAERLGATVRRHELLPHTTSPLNPSGVIVIEKDPGVAATRPRWAEQCWRCPLTHAPLADQGDVFIAAETGIAYPVLRGVPLLRAEHAVVASKLARPAAA